MSEKTAKGIVVIVAVLVGLYGLLLRPTTSNDDRFRYVGTVGVVFVGLSLLVDISPEVAGPLALLIGLAVYARYLEQKRGGSLTPAQSKTATAKAQQAGTSAFGSVPSF